MNEAYLIALANLAMCMVSTFICICRLNSMQRRVRRVRWVVRAEYSVGVGAMLASGFRPLIGEWPGYASLVVAAYVLLALIASSRAWHGDRPPEIATDHVPLGDR